MTSVPVDEPTVTSATSLQPNHPTAEPDGPRDATYRERKDRDESDAGGDAGADLHV